MVTKGMHLTFYLMARISINMSRQLRVRLMVHLKAHLRLRLKLRVHFRFHMLMHLLVYMSGQDNLMKAELESSLYVALEVAPKIFF